jgi:hypothetical protein
VGRYRQLVAIAFAVLVVVGMVVGDAVTLHKAKPSFRDETRAFNGLLHPPPATTTTTTTTSATTPPVPTASP